MAEKRTGRASWLVASIVAFLCLDIALVVIALQPRTDSQDSANPPSAAISSVIPTGTPASTPSPTPTSLPTSTNSAIPAVSLGADFRFLGLTTDGIGFRATKGSCVSDTSVVEKTGDGGVTWEKTNPSDLDIRETDSLAVVDESHVDLLARIGDTCTASAVSTYTQGEFWQAYPNRTSSLSSAPMPTSSPLGGVYAVASSDNLTVVARFGEAACAGLLVQSVPSITSADPTSLGCLTQVTQPTPIAVAVEGSTLWVWAASSVYTSTDLGANWKAAS